PALSGVPRVFAAGQGGLLDVALDRSFTQNRTIYFCYAEPVDGGARTALARARLSDEATPRLHAVGAVFRHAGPLSSAIHFASRTAQPPDHNALRALGEPFSTLDQAQNLANNLGNITRTRPDGSAPPDNPSPGKAGPKPQIRTHGHRNPQAPALPPATGK